MQEQMQIALGCVTLSKKENHENTIEQNSAIDYQVCSVAGMHFYSHTTHADSNLDSMSTPGPNIVQWLGGMVQHNCKTSQFQEPSL